MGTNFYFRFKDKQAKDRWFQRGEYELIDEPDFGYEVHIAKTSGGWKPLFQMTDRIRSVAVMRMAYEDIPGCLIVDEYSKEYSWKQFAERVLEFNKSKIGVASEDEVDNNHCISHLLYDFARYHPICKPDAGYMADPDGYEFAITQFR